MAILDCKAIECLDYSIENKLRPLLNTNQYKNIDECLEYMISILHKTIPEKKRVSYGITYVIKTISNHLYNWLEVSEFNTLEIAYILYSEMLTFRTKCVGLGVISNIGVRDTDNVLPYFKHAATHDMWEVREFAQMYIRKITKINPDKVQEFLLELTKSDNPNHRRFASESLRPVAENKWINYQTEFSLKVLRELFKENDPYPRTSVGNNLIDLSRKSPELIFSIVEKLVACHDENSYWIAYRACRNLVIKEPLRVMNLLNIDKYIYKNKKYYRG